MLSKRVETPGRNIENGRGHRRLSRNWGTGGMEASSASLKV